MLAAVHAFLDWAFGVRGLRRIEADIAPANEASARLLAHLGFRREARLRERWCVKGAISDSVIYGLLAREWSGPEPDADGAR